MYPNGACAGDGAGRVTKEGTELPHLRPAAGHASGSPQDNLSRLVTRCCPSDGPNNNPVAKACRSFLHFGFCKDRLVADRRLTVVPGAEEESRAPTEDDEAAIMILAQATLGPRGCCWPTGAHSWAARLALSLPFARLAPSQVWPLSPVCPFAYLSVHITHKKE